RLEEMRERAAGAEELARVRKEARDAKRLAELRVEAEESPAVQTDSVSIDDIDELAASGGIGEERELAEPSRVAEPDFDTRPSVWADEPAPRGLWAPIERPRFMKTPASEDAPSEDAPSEDARVSAANPRPVIPSIPVIRTWARKHGYSVGERGRIPDAVREAYLDAHPTAAPAATRSSDGPAIIEFGENGAAAAAAWREGASYQLDTAGNILPLYSGRTLASVIGEVTASIVRDAMQTVRPSGGRFKVDQNGTMATLIDGNPVYVCTVTRAGWFPAHWIGN
ncbi:MAG: Lsr2 family DNA-binding protein, partial [Pseudoclavibacter sp.]